MSLAQLNTQSELRWHCRRGMLELDILLNSFLDKGYHLLSAEEKKQFEVLLDYPDQTLFDLLLEKMQSSDSNVTKLINKIKNIN